MLHVATELSTITQLSPALFYSYFLPCQRWLAVKEDDGQIARELVPVDRALKSKLSQKDSMAVRNEIALETAGTCSPAAKWCFRGEACFRVRQAFYC